MNSTAALFCAPLIRLVLGAVRRQSVTSVRTGKRVGVGQDGDRRLRFRRTSCPESDSSASPTPRSDTTWDPD